MITGTTKKEDTIEYKRRKCWEKGYKIVFQPEPAYPFRKVKLLLELPNGKTKPDKDNAWYLQNDKLEKIVNQKYNELYKHLFGHG